MIFNGMQNALLGLDLLLLLEGSTVNLPRPKNQFATDMTIHRDNKLPILATSKSRIEFVGKYNQRDVRETEMMDTRWRVFQFSYQLEKDQVKEMSPCQVCFSKLVVLGHDV